MGGCVGQRDEPFFVWFLVWGNGADMAWVSKAMGKGGISLSPSPPDQIRSDRYIHLRLWELAGVLP